MRTVILMLVVALLVAEEARPVVLGLDAEFGHQASASAQAVERGMRLAIAEVNAAGGVLGRPVRLETRDHRSIPARAEADFRDLAAIPEVVAIMGGKFSTATLPCVPLAHALGVPFLLPWSSADGLIDHGHTPSWTFRLSLKDSWVAPALIERAVAGGGHRVGFLMPANAWGHSNEQAALAYLAQRGMTAAGFAWYPFGSTTMLAPYAQLLQAGADVVVLVANEGEGAVLVRELASAPADHRRPLVCHWGISGGDFPAMTGPGLATLDLQVIQTFSFLRPSPISERVLAALRQQEPALDPGRVRGAVGLAQAYDLTHLVLQAVVQAGRAERDAVRAALEHLAPWEGLLGRYAPAFTPERHEALSPERVFFCRWDHDGRLVPVP